MLRRPTIRVCVLMLEELQDVRLTRPAGYGSVFGNDTRVNQFSVIFMEVSPALESPTMSCLTGPVDQCSSEQGIVVIIALVGPHNTDLQAVAANGYQMLVISLLSGYAKSNASRNLPSTYTVTTLCVTPIYGHLDIVPSTLVT
jgi:hypothetical protein